VHTYNFYPNVFAIPAARLAGTPVVLGNPTVIPGVGVTHLCYPVRKA